MKKISRMLTMALVLGISIFSMSIAAYAGKQQPQAKKLAQEESKPKEYSFKSGNSPYAGLKMHSSAHRSKGNNIRLRNAE